MTRRILPLIALLALLSLLAPAAASAATAPVFTADFFKKQVQAGLAEEDEETLIRNLTDLHGKLRTLNYPNCFECALWLAQQQVDTTPRKRLVLAEYAVRLAPDLPEAYLNRFATVLAERPGDLGLMSASLWRWVTASVAGPQRDAFIGALLRLALLFSAGLFLAMTVAMLFKYGRAIAHLYGHVGAFSLSHKALGFAAGGAAVALAVKGVVGLEVFFLLWLLFCYRIARYRELSALILLFAGYLAADIGLSMLSRTAPDLRSDGWSLYRAVYDPPFAAKVPADDGRPAALLARGVQALYDRDWDRADRMLALYERDLRDGTSMAIVANLRGIAASESGKREAARRFFTDAVKHDETPAYLFNMSRALYAEGNLREAEEVEMRSIALGGKKRFDFPVLVLPLPYAFAREAAGIEPPGGLLNDPLTRRVAGLIILLLAAIVMWRVAGARTGVACCVECGGIICEECGGGDDEVCLTCRIVKAGKSLVSTTAQEAHADRRERWSARRRALSVVLSFFLPGAGLLYNDDIFEGLLFMSLFAFLLLLLITTRFFTFTAVTASALSLAPIAATALLLLLWLASLLRSWRAANTE